MTLAERHVKQFDGTRCASFNCAAASAAMAIYWGTNGRVALTASQVRTKSEISCTPGADTRSGGLRAIDVQRVAAAYGVTVDYGGNGLINWPAGELYNRLASNHAAIVLGDANRLPVNPTSGVVYHSIFGHALRVGSQGRETHMHDPRNTSGIWVPLSALDRYQLGMEGVRFSGFVALPAPDTSMPPPGGSTDMSIGLRTENGRPGRWNLEVIATYPVSAVVVHNNNRIPLPKGTRKSGVLQVYVPRQTGIAYGGEAFVLEDENPTSPDPLAVLFERDVRALKVG